MVSCINRLYREVFGTRNKLVSTDDLSIHLKSMSASLSDTSFNEFDDDFDQDQKDIAATRLDDDFTETWTDGFAVVSSDLI